MTRRQLAIALLAGCAILAWGCAPLGEHDHRAGSVEGANTHSSAAAHARADADARILVRFPEEMKTHTLSNMRDHLLALAEIQEALARNAFEAAAGVAEKRLGMTSLTAHGAHDTAKYMPKGMQDIGTAMHRGASQFAIEAQNSAATGDLKPSLMALSRATQACVACHAAYRLQ